MSELHTPWATLMDGMRAAPCFAQTRTVFEFSRLAEFSADWNGWLLLLGSAAIIAYVTWLYRRDARELPRGVRWSLLLLRLLAFAGLLVYFLDLEKRTERQVTRVSRVAVLVDTSQSMGLVDRSAGISRLQQVIDEFARGPLLSELQAKHDVAVYRFDKQSAPQPVQTFARAASSSAETQITEDHSAAFAMSWWLLRAALLLGGLALAALIGSWVAGNWWRGAEGESYLLLIGIVGLAIAVVLAGVVNLRSADRSLAELWRGQPSTDSPATSQPNAVTGTTAVSPAPAEVAWSTTLVPQGVETRLGDAVRWVLDQERDGPLAGIVLLTDGRQNAGTAPDAVARVAAGLGIPIYPIGLGSEQQPRNIRIVDLEVPPRVYPKDPCNITGYIQADGLAGRTVRLRLEQRTLEDQPTTPPVQMEQRVTLPEDSQIISVPFSVVSDRVGRFRWQLEVVANEADDLDDSDNRRYAVMEVIERKNRVLLFAGGPMRDYHFLHTLLFRDPTTEVDVRLQSAPPGAAQEANQVLLDFPADRDTLFSYDCLVAFDPDWTELTADQIRMLDEWVAEKAGGLVLVAGPVHTPNWTRGTASDDAKLASLRDLYPVTFYRSGAATIQLGRVASDTAWPLRFTEEGRRASFLWLDDSAATSAPLWDEFAGVYGYQAIRGSKPGAQVYATFSDPQAATSDDAPIYMAGHFYGAGRVFYLGSGEMWRLNALDPNYFATFYTKLIRHVSQGRLLRDSSRGILLVDNERCSLGDTITVRAVLADVNYQPLALESVPAALLQPNGQRQPLTLKRLITAERPGMYAAEFTATQPGDYRIELAIPGVDNELLTRDVKVRLPALEIESPQRNDPLLAALANQSQGQYFVGLASARGESGVPGLPLQIRVRDQVTFIPGTPDPVFEATLMTWLLVLICGALCFEWLLRRLYKLA